MRSVNTLCRNLRDAEDRGTLLRLIAAVVKLGDPAAIPSLAFLLDTPGPVGRAAVNALIGFGPASEPAMRACLEAVDEDMVRNAHRVLAALGDRHSAVARHAFCWSDLDENPSFSAANQAA